ncbi:glycosyltransferase [Halochromatium roseum]|uniref:glycosyltransferase n=1 Tax=Halochromatium roseum TaxID=391920 RepID=UPI0030843805
MARDEAAQIGACLESARAVVDAMVVLDTGSSDETMAIARAAGAEVYHFAWNDDFAAARNAALAQSRTPWNLILDADEHLAEGAEQLRAAVAKPADFIGVLPVVSGFDLAGQVDTSTAWIPRLLPAGVRYQGRVHEQPVSEWPRVRLPVTIHHSGYRRAALKRKQGRNRKLLLAMLAERPEEASLHYQQGKNCEVYDDFEEAARQYQHALQASALLSRQPAAQRPVVSAPAAAAGRDQASTPERANGLATISRDQTLMSTVRPFS